MAEAQTVEEFWEQARRAVADLPVEPTESWAFGATPQHADGLLSLVLAGTKTGTASALWDYEATGERMPEEGDVSVILDGSGSPRAVIRTTGVRIVPFDEVDEEHAHAEGEGDRTLRAWREIHERFWTQHGESGRPFSPDMPVICERFELVFSDS